MGIEFKVQKIVEYLDRYKKDLPQLYNWDVKLDALSKLIGPFKSPLNQSAYEKNLWLRGIVATKLQAFSKNDAEKFEQLCLWIIRDWGGISRGSFDTIRVAINQFLQTEELGFQRIASTSKIASFFNPDKYLIYDSRVAYALNWILLSTNAGNQFFPIPEGRNSKLAAFDMNVLIRLKNISSYKLNDLTELENRQFIRNRDKGLFISKNNAYKELNFLSKAISEQLWQEDESNKLLRTEMLLFSIADKQITQDITTRLSLVID